MAENQTVVGRIAGLYRYPVKSMGGEDLQEANVRWTGVEGDRRFAFVRAEDGKPAHIDFPWFTGREYPPMVTYRAAYRDGGDIVVTTPDGREMSVGSDGLHAEIAEGSGKSALLLRIGRGAYDGMPLSLLSTASIAAVANASGIDDHAPHRYRPNILVDLAPDTHEDAWVGRMLTIGSDLKIWVTRPDPRCMMININPQTGVQQPQVLKHVARERGNNLGIYATVLNPGRIAVGDTITMY